MYVTIYRERAESIRHSIDAFFYPLCGPTVGTNRLFLVGFDADVDHISRASLITHIFASLERNLQRMPAMINFPSYYKHVTMKRMTGLIRAKITPVFISPPHTHTLPHTVFNDLASITLQSFKRLDDAVVKDNPNTRTRRGLAGPFFIIIIFLLHVRHYCCCSCYLRISLKVHKSSPTPD